MPLSENPRNITRLGQNLGQGGRLESHALALQDGMGDTVLQRMPAGHKGGAGRGAGGTDEEPREPGALVVQGIQVRRIYPRMPMTTHGSVALVIRHHQNNVGFFAEGWLRGLGRSQAEGRGNNDEHRIYEVTGHGGISFQ